MGIEWQQRFEGLSNYGEENRMKKKIFLMVLLVLIFVFNTPFIVQGGEQVIEKIYKVPDNNGLLRLEKPLTWNDEVDMSTESHGFIVKFSPPLPISSTFYLKVFWSPKGETGFNAPKMVKERVEKDGMKLLPQAVEKNIQLRIIKGKETMTGYYYRLTDKNPNPGGFKYICQGGIGVGNLLLTFTIFTNVKDSDVEQSALSILVSAEQLPDK
jgi:hypothetical protein